MTEAAFSKKVEPIIHATSNLYAVIGSVYLLVDGHFGSTDEVSWIRCDHNDTKQCRLYYWVFIDFAAGLAFVIITMNWCSIISAISRQNASSARYRQMNSSLLLSKRNAARRKSLPRRLSLKHFSRSSVSELEMEECDIEGGQRSDFGPDGREILNSNPADLKRLQQPAPSQNTFCADLKTETSTFTQAKSWKSTSCSSYSYCEDTLAFNLQSVRAKVASERSGSNEEIKQTSSRALSGWRNSMHDQKKTKLESQGRDIILQAVLFSALFVVSWVFTVSAQ